MERSGLECIIVIHLAKLLESRGKISMLNMQRKFWKIILESKAQKGKTVLEKELKWSRSIVSILSV